MAMTRRHGKCISQTSVRLSQELLPNDNTTFANVNEPRGCIFCCVRPFCERAVSDLNPVRYIHRPVQVAHSSFIEGSLTTKNTASEQVVKTIFFWNHLNICFVSIVAKVCLSMLNEQSVYLIAAQWLLDVDNFNATIQREPI